MKRPQRSSQRRGSGSTNQTPAAWVYVVIFVAMLGLTGFLYAVGGQPMSAHATARYETAIMPDRSRFVVPPLPIPSVREPSAEVPASQPTYPPQDIRVAASDHTDLQDIAKDLADALKESKWHRAAKKAMRRKLRLDEDIPEVRGREGKVRHHKSIHEEVEPRVRGRPEGSDDPADAPHRRKKRKPKFE